MKEEAIKPHISVIEPRMRPSAIDFRCEQEKRQKTAGTQYTSCARSLIRVLAARRIINIE